MQTELGEETVEQGSKSSVKRSSRREPLGFAYFGLVLFMVVYFARPEDWIPGLAGVPLAKITGILILLALAVFGQQHPLAHAAGGHFPQSACGSTLARCRFLSSLERRRVNVMLDFSKVLPLVIIIYAAARSMKRLRWILFVQASFRRRNRRHQHCQRAHIAWPPARCSFRHVRKFERSCTCHRPKPPSLFRHSRLPPEVIGRSSHGPLSCLR